MLSAEDIQEWNDVVNNQSKDNPLCRDCRFRHDKEHCKDCDGLEWVGYLYDFMVEG